MRTTNGTLSSRSVSAAFTMPSPSLSAADSSPGEDTLTTMTSRFSRRPKFLLPVNPVALEVPIVGAHAVPAVSAERVRRVRPQRLEELAKIAQLLRGFGEENLRLEEPRAAPARASHRTGRR